MCIRDRVEAQRQNGDQIIDVQGRLVLPGLCDTHLHCYNKGCTLQNIDLQDVSSIEEIVSRSREYIQAHPDSSVIHGRGWNHDYFAEARILNQMCIRDSYYTMDRRPALFLFCESCRKSNIEYDLTVPASNPGRLFDMTCDLFGLTQKFFCSGGCGNATMKTNKKGGAQDEHFVD